MVLLPAPEYKPLKRRDCQKLLVSEHPEDELQNLLESEWAEEGKQFDHELEKYKA